MRAAIIGASHWHVPLYEPGFERAGVRVISVWDPDPASSSRLAERHRAKAVPALADLLEARDFDIAFVFGRHVDLPDLALQLIDCGIPVALEKPCGRTARDVAGIREAAERRGLYVTVPLVQRVAPLGHMLADIASREAFTGLSFRFIAGPPERYERAHCPWMLRPLESGGGAAINLAVHFVDLAQFLARSRASTVFAQTSSLLHCREIDDYAFIAMRLSNGADALVEVGYSYPDVAPHREFRFSLIGRDSYVEGGGEVLRLTSRTGEAREMSVTFDTDTYYADYVCQVVEEVAAGRRPSVGLVEMEAALRVVDAAYESARSGSPVALTP